MTTHESFLRDLARLAVWYPLRWFVGSRPPLQAIATLERVGDLHARLSRGGARALAAKVARIQALPPDTAADIRDYYRTHYISQLIAFLFPHLTPQGIATIHRFTGLERVDALRKEGKGCILLHGHYGAVHLPLFHLGSMKYNVKQLGFLHGSEELSAIGRHVSFRLRARLESHIPAEVINADRFLRGVFEHLQGGGIMLMTGDSAGRGIFVGKHQEFDFLGGQRLFPLGAGKIALKTRSAILPMVTRADTKPHTFVSEIGEPFNLDGLNEVDIARLFVAQLERNVRSAPCLWHQLDEL